MGNPTEMLVRFSHFENLLAERGIVVSYKAIRPQCLKFGPTYAHRPRRCQRRLGDTWFLEEAVIVPIHGGRR